MKIWTVFTTLKRTKKYDSRFKSMNFPAVTLQGLLARAMTRLSERLMLGDASSQSLS